MTTTRTNTVDVGALIRAGILALPIGGGLKLVGNLGTFEELVGSILPVLIGLFGVFALFAYLAPLADRRVLVPALICTVLGAGIVLPALGVINYAIPALGHAYLAGQPAAMQIADSFFTWPRGAMTYPAALYPIGTLLFAIALWRSSPLPRTAVVLFAASGVLIAIPFPLHALRLAGGVILLGAGTWIAAFIRRATGASQDARHPRRSPRAGHRR